MAKVSPALIVKRKKLKHAHDYKTLGESFDHLKAQLAFFKGMCDSPMKTVLGKKIVESVEGKISEALKHNVFEDVKLVPSEHLKGLEASEIAAMLENTHKHMQEHPEEFQSPPSSAQPLNGYVTQDGKVYGPSSVWGMFKKWKEDIAKCQAEQETPAVGHFEGMPDTIVTASDIWYAERAIAREIYLPLQFEPESPVLTETILSIAREAIEYWIVPRLTMPMSIMKEPAAQQIKHLVDRLLWDSSFYQNSMEIDSYEELAEILTIQIVPHLMGGPDQPVYPIENIELSFVLDTCGSHEIGLTKKGRETLHRFGAVAKDEA
ncbi:hypothetical protein LCGC14_1865500 [marine sediment metagenome]|uniref:Uncharacterized protein n=1 Tax=marine sediment metagenome TaxID=412755 RepID=A0A0F9G6N2_9ZZZZ